MDTSLKLSEIIIDQFTEIVNSVMRKNAKKIEKIRLKNVYILRKLNILTQNKRQLFP